MTLKHSSKWIAAHVIGALLCLVSSACTKVPQSIRDLPELPADTAKDLVPARTAPVLITGPLQGPVRIPPDRSTKVLPLEPPRACKTSWDGYVVFPITVCHAPPLADLDLASQSGISKTIPGVARIDDAKFFKLSKHPKVSIRDLLFCSVRSGPWFAHVEGEQKCNTNPNVRSFTALILGAPEPVVVTWTGVLSDVPPPLVLAAITESSVVCTCCSGVTCPDGTCRPDIDHCGVMPPAIK